MNTTFSNDLVVLVRQMEKAISSHPCVEDVVVITFDDPQDGQIFHAFIEPNSENPPTEQSIIEFFKERINSLEVPLNIVFAKIPRTPTGKVSRQKLLSQAGLT